NEDNKVAYYSDTEDRIFPRSRAIIGRSVQKCHPPKSVDIVEDILEQFKTGEKKVAEFWIQLGDAFVFIRYFAMHDASGKYIGTLEVSQEISQIKSLEGERRLVQWRD
ncbi:MAG: PAS domain-containing protein, partial [Candidatus Heimdallarchaeota archaeon]